MKQIAQKIRENVVDGKKSAYVINEWPLRQGQDKLAHITIDEEKRIFACHGSDNIIELFLVCSDEEVKKRLQKRAKKERRKNGTGLNSYYLKMKISKHSSSRTQNLLSELLWSS